MAGLSWVVNFANSVVGVGVLAMPYCFSQCGILLATFLILLNALMTKKTCEFLLRAASYTRRSTFEQIALHLFGDLGKLTTEISIMGLLIGTLVAFQVVIGDLAPAVVHNIIGVKDSWSLRAMLMIASCFVILPLSLMRNVASLASFNALSMGFYIFFIFIITLLALPSLYSMEWLANCNFWRVSAIFKALPIISIAFTCQTQVLVMYAALPDPNMKTMTEIINKAINLVATIYISVGSLGYIAFYKDGIHGDVLENFPHSFSTDGIKFGFWFSVVLSYPLIVFPVRAAINSLLYANKKQGVLHDVISSASDYIAPEKFNLITIGLVIGTLIVGILIPNIETILSITGALVGTFLCFIFPSALFIKGGAKDLQRKLAQTILVVSTIVMVLSTTSVISNISVAAPRPEHDVHTNVKQMIEPQVNEQAGMNPIKPNLPIEPVISQENVKIENRVKVEKIQIADTADNKNNGEPVVVKKETEPVLPIAIKTEPPKPKEKLQDTDINVGNQGAGVVKKEDGDNTIDIEIKEKVVKNPQVSENIDNQVDTEKKKLENEEKTKEAKESIATIDVVNKEKDLESKEHVKDTQHEDTVKVESKLNDSGVLQGDAPKVNTGNRDILSQS